MIDSPPPPPLDSDRLTSRPASANQSIQAGYNPPPKPPSRSRIEITAVTEGRSDPRSSRSSEVRPQTRSTEGFNPPPDPPSEPLVERSTIRPQTKEGRPSEDEERSASRSESTVRSESGEPSRNPVESTLEPDDYTVEELKDELEEVTDDEELETMLEREENGSNRRTAKEAIRRRMRSLGETESSEDQ